VIRLWISVGCSVCVCVSVCLCVCVCVCVREERERKCVCLPETEIMRDLHERDTDRTRSLSEIMCDSS